MFYQRILMISTLVLASGIFYGCNSREAGISVTPNARVSPPQLSYGSLIIPDKSDRVIIPVGILADANRSITSEMYRDSLVLTNLIFYDKIKNTSELLLDRKAIISQFEILGTQNQRDSQVPSEAITVPDNPQFSIYKIIEKDTNGDGELNNNDASIGYLSSLKGKELRAITPENSQLINWSFYSQNKLIFLEIQKDANSDNKFADDRDSKMLYFYDLEQKKLRPITPENNRLQEWQFEESSNLVFAKIQKDSDRDGAFTDKDDITFLKIDLRQPDISHEMLDDKLREKIKSLQ
jgi:hypothetical protein